MDSDSTHTNWLSVPMHPQELSWPDATHILVVVALISIVATIIWILVITFSSNRIRCSQDLERVTGLRVLAVLAGATQRIRLFGRSRASRKNLLAIKRVRSRLLVASIDKRCPRLTILTPARSPDQEPFIHDLVRSLRELGRKALVLRVHDDTETDPAPWPPAATTDPVGFDSVDIGTGAARLSDRLESPEWRTALHGWETTYDHILIDAPPILSGTEAVALTRIANQAILLARWDDTDDDSLEDSLTALESLSGRIIGCALTGVPLSALKRLGLGNVTEARYPVAQ